MSVPCSDQELRPTKSKNASLPPGVIAERCWCGHLAKVKEVEDFSDQLGMKFFMCANYDASPPRRASSSSTRPPVCCESMLNGKKNSLIVFLTFLFLLQSPPPLCKWYHWIDKEQPAWALQEIEDRSRRAWDQFFAEERAEKAAAREKEEREKALIKLRAQQARNIEVNQRRRYAEEHAAKEAREVQRRRYRERAAEAEAAEKRGDKTGKHPRWTQDH